jgi:DNA-binding transcriptional MerR regulator
MQQPHHQPESSTPEIPDKLYFRIGEAAQLAGVEPYVLRYWETEFPQLSVKKSGTGQRLFRRKDVELILELKRLLYEKRFTIEGARLYLEHNKPGKKAAPKPIPKRKAEVQPALFDSVPGQDIEKIRQELQAILELLR